MAADAGIDPSMVIRYFGNKARLFDAVLDIDLRLPDLTGAPPTELPRLLVRLFLDRWESDRPATHCWCCCARDRSRPLFR